MGFLKALSIPSFPTGTFYTVTDSNGSILFLTDTKYVDSSTLSAIAECKAYADGSRDQAISSAKAYADSVVTNYLQALVPDWVYPPLQERNILEVYDGSKWTLYSTRDYADRVGASVFASSKVALDASIASMTTQLTNLVNASCASTLTQSKEYANLKKIESETYTDNHKWTVATIIDFDDAVKAYGYVTKTYADTQDALTLKTAKDYADTKASKVYVDAQDQSILNQAKTYATLKDAIVLNISKGYTDDEIAKISLSNFSFDAFLEYIDMMDEN